MFFLIISCNRNKNAILGAGRGVEGENMSPTMSPQRAGNPTTASRIAFGRRVQHRMNNSSPRVWQGGPIRKCESKHVLKKGQKSRDSVKDSSWKKRLKYDATLLSSELAWGFEGANMSPTMSPKSHDGVSDSSWEQLWKHQAGFKRECQQHSSKRNIPVRCGFQRV